MDEIWIIVIAVVIIGIIGVIILAVNNCTYYTRPLTTATSTNTSNTRPMIQSLFAGMNSGLIKVIDETPLDSDITMSQQVVDQAISTLGGSKSDCATSDPESKLWALITYRNSRLFDIMNLCRKKHRMTTAANLSSDGSSSTEEWSYTGPSRSMDSDTLASESVDQLKRYRDSLKEADQELAKLLNCYLKDSDLNSAIESMDSELIRYHQAVVLQDSSSAQEHKRQLQNLINQV